MTYTQIRRGPMGGDHYTQIHNGVFRDSTLTPNAKAIFGWISTHKQGWNTSLTAIAEAVGIGHAAAKKAVQLLKQRHYLVYGQDRRPDGTKGHPWYFLTDLPAQITSIGITDDAIVSETVQRALDRWLSENPSSPPVGQKPPTGGLETQAAELSALGLGVTSAFPQVVTGGTKTAPPVEPLAAEERTKKTKEPQEDQDKKTKKSDLGLRAVRPETRTQVDDVASPNVTRARETAANHPNKPTSTPNRPAPPTNSAASWPDPQATDDDPEDDYLIARALVWVERECGGFVAGDREAAAVWLQEYSPQTVTDMILKRRAA